MSVLQATKTIAGFTLLICLPFFSTGQTADPYPYATDIVKFDIVTLRTDKSVPFDKPFVLVVDNINTENIVRVSLYRAKSVAGNRKLYPDTKTDSYADYIFSSKETIIEKNKLTLLVPALRPAKDFDILVEKKLSGKNIEKAQALNKIIIDNNLNPAAPGYAWPRNATMAFLTLRDSANNSNFTPPRDVFTVADQDDYYTNVFKHFETNYRNMTDDAKFTTTTNGFVYLTTAEIAAITNSAPLNGRPFNDSYILTQIEKETSINDLLLGLRTIGYTYGSKLTERDEFDKRVTNLNASIVFFDSLYKTANEIAAKNAGFVSTRDRVLTILGTFQSNKKVLTDNLKSITDELRKQNEAIWLIGTTQSKDLQTKSSSIFTVDAGMANMWARDLSNKVVYIPKLFWSVNIYFRGVDKNIRSRYFPKKKKKETLADGTILDYDVLSHKTPFNRFCLNVGFTFGSLDKQNFDNFFAGSSMLVGPSYRLTRSFRLSGGAVFLNRAPLNPLLSEKKITTGGYLSLSLDFDILGALKNVSSLFFK